jgi:N-acetyl-alpha-D-muramate 1-phosphate uridylyltransferase
MFPVAILAGGLGTRLHPATEQLPKALVRIGDRPFIHWQLALLAQQGITDVVLCIGHLGEQIRAAVDEGAASGLTVRYSCDGDVLLGTGGALRRALPMLGPSFFVLYGDSYPPCSFAAVQAAYELRGAPALMTVLRNEDRWDRSNVLFRDGRIVEYNKRAPRPGMAHVDFGLGILASRVLETCSNGAVFDLADVYQALATRGELGAYEVGERFYEIGSVAGIEATERYLAAGNWR